MSPKSLWQTYMKWSVVTVWKLNLELSTYTVRVKCSTELCLKIEIVNYIGWTFWQTYVAMNKYCFKAVCTPQTATVIECLFTAARIPTMVFDLVFSPLSTSAMQCILIMCTVHLSTCIVWKLNIENGKRRTSSFWTFNNYIWKSV